MNLIIDVGNTFAKVAVFQKNGLISKKTVGKDELEKTVADFFLNYPEISGVVISNVSNTTISLPANHPKRAKILHLSENTTLPFKNLYSTPQTLGNDRKALVAAAAQQYPLDNVLVIDAGTCITYDFKDKGNEYLGGAISPGLKMRYKALHDYTSGLPLVEFRDQIELVGTSTQSSINSGVNIGVLKEIEGVVREYTVRYENLRTIITGGDAHFLSINLKNGIFANSNFLLEGLNYILEFNNNK